MSEPPQRPSQEREGTDLEAGNPPQPAPRNSVTSFVFITFVLFMLTNNGGDEFIIKNQYRDSLQSLKQQQSNFTAWMNGTASNFTMKEYDNTQISLVNSIMAFGIPLNPETASYYENITGFIHGPAEVHNLTSYQNETTRTDSEHSLSLPVWSTAAAEFMAGLNLTDAVERMGAWNWTACNKVAFSVLEKKPRILQRGSSSSVPDVQLDDDISLIHGRIDLTDANTGDELRFELEAVHFLSNGTLFGLAQATGRHVDVRLLPSLVPPTHMNATAKAVEIELRSRITRLQGLLESGSDEMDPYVEEVPMTTCPFTFYGQIIPTNVPVYLMKELEDELEHPTGISTVRRPELRLNGVLASKECGILYEINGAEGLKSQRFWRKVTTYSGTAAIMYLTLLVLLSRQQEASRTPAGISRISRWSFLTQAAADSISFVGHITFGVLAEGRPSLSLIAPAFLACILLIQEAQFSVLIHQVQAPEEVRSPPVRTSPPATLTGTPSTPATMTTPTPPVQTQPSLLGLTWDRLWSNPQARLWLMIFFSITVIVRVMVSPSLGLLVIGIVYSMFWIPQIVRSARRGTAGGLRVEYLVGTTACRVFFALYIFACPKNVLGIESTWWIYVVVGFVCLQVVVLILQENLGPGFFLPKSYTPADAYDYHPSLPRRDAEAPEHTLGDCAICMDDIVVPVEQRVRRKSASERRSRDGEKEREKERVHGGGGAGLLGAVGMGIGIGAARVGVGVGRKSWAVAPCHHTFHTSCLERWLAIKNICPQCRRPLPPL